MRSGDEERALMCIELLVKSRELHTCDLVFLDIAAQDERTRQERTLVRVVDRGCDYIQFSHEPWHKK